MNLNNFTKNLNNSLPLKFSREILGKEFNISLILPIRKIPPSVVQKNKLKDDRTFCDFSKNPVLIQYSHGKHVKSKLLKTLEDKKILTNTINMEVTPFQEQLNSINLENCLKTFDEIVLDYNSQDISVFPFMNKYYIGEESTNKFDSVNFEKIVKKHSEFKREDSVKRIGSEIKRLLSLWSLPVDTSGSVKQKNNILKYLNIDNGYIAISSSNIQSLKKGKKPSCFSYEDAESENEKLCQKINLGTSEFKFLPKDNANAVITGYSEKYTKDLLEYWLKTQLS